MHVRNLLVVAGGLAVLAPMALAQNTPSFSIRKPIDGSTVREKVRVSIPLGSIPEGGYVAISIDGKFREALTPSDEQRKNIKPGAEFVYIWDTKAATKSRGFTDKAPDDGEHEISATLYAPAEGTTGLTTKKDTSSVKVTVANKINTDPGAVLLRYRFPDRANRTYDRRGETAIVAGLSGGVTGADDQELVGQRSKLAASVEDVYKDGSAIVRNKLTELYVRQGGQETYYPSDNLPRSLYQQLNPLGKVVYQNAPVSFEEFAALGIPVETTLELPRLPAEPKRIGDSWTTTKGEDKETLDIPGTAPDKQPKVHLRSTLVGLEWEGGYQTAKIHQVFDSRRDTGFTEKSIIFGTTEVENPQLSYERDIYLAYRSGTLIKVSRKLEVSGTTSQPINTGAGATASAGGPLGSPMGASMYGGMGMPGGGMTTGTMGMGGMMSQMMNSRAMSQRMGGGQTTMGASSMYGQGGMAPAGARNGRRGGMGMGAPPGMGSGGMAGMMMQNMGRGGPGGKLGGMGGGPTGGTRTMGGGGFAARTGTAPTSNQITLKSTTVTELAKPEAKTAKVATIGMQHKTRQ